MFCERVAINCNGPTGGRFPWLAFLEKTMNIVFKWNCRKWWFCSQSNSRICGHDLVYDWVNLNVSSIIFLPIFLYNEKRHCKLCFIVEFLLISTIWFTWHAILRKWKTLNLPFAWSKRSTIVSEWFVAKVVFTVEMAFELSILILFAE